MQEITERTTRKTRKRALVSYAQLDVPLFFNSLKKNLATDNAGLAAALNINEVTVKNLMKGEAPLTERLIRGLLLSHPALTNAAIQITAEASH